MGSQYVIHCERCGKTATRKRPAKYCSTQCKDRRHRPNRSHRRHRPGQERSCLVCEKVYRPKRAASKDGQKCCSRECGFEWLRIKKALSRRAVYRVFRKPRPVVEPVVRQCSRCGDTFEPYKWARSLCLACREVTIAERRAASRRAFRASQAGRAAKAADRKARKLRLRGVKVETVNPLAVLSRDKWTCQLCGVKTPKHLRGTYDDRAPEVDHIIPIAEGGEHSYRNVQCACRRCNLSKSGRAMGQLRLFG